MELPLLNVLADMERAGIAADLDHLATLEARLGGEVKRVAQAAYDSIGHEFNLGSPKQLQQVLFDELQLPKTKRIKTGYTTDADALLWLSEQSDHPLLEHLLRHRDVSRLKTVVDSLMPMVDDSGRVHTTFNQIVAATGRLSSQDPNLQNIPIRTAEGREIRRAFVVGSGYECLLTADYSQIEMRIMAHLSADAGLIEAFESGFNTTNGDQWPGIDSRYRLIVVAALRSKQLLRGARPRIAADLAILHERSFHVGLQIELDALAAVRARHEELIVRHRLVPLVATAERSTQATNQFACVAV